MTTIKQFDYEYKTKRAGKYKGGFNRLNQLCIHITYHRTTHFRWDYRHCRPASCRFWLKEGR